jgi:hypothetical protein
MQLFVFYKEIKLIPAELNIVTGLLRSARNDGRGEFLFAFNRPASKHSL